jgi:hypothetical protein
MYETYNELTQVPGSRFVLGGTEWRLEKVGSGQRVAALKSQWFNPALENIVVKALAGALSVRNEFIEDKPSTTDKKKQEKWREKWRGRRSTREHSGGERVALYLSMGIHLAADISRHDLGREQSDENDSDEKHSDQSQYVSSARSLKDYYLKNQPPLDAFMRKKDADDLIGIYELTKPENFRNLPVIDGFCRVLHEYASHYIERLGAQTKNSMLQGWGPMLWPPPKPEIKSDYLYPVRELIMWEKVQHAKASDYLLVGMGDKHRQNLKEKLKTEGINDKKVDQDLKAQRDEIDRNWVASATIPWWKPWLGDDPVAAAAFFQLLATIEPRGPMYASEAGYHEEPGSDI